MKRIALLLVALGCAFAACGCASTPLERQTFAICMSVDPTEDGQFKIAIQAPKSGQSAEGGVTSSYEVLSASSKTLRQALHVLAATTPYPINFSQLRLCLIRYELAATSNLRETLRFLEEMPTMRPNATVMVTLGDALAVMEAQKPEFGMRLSTHLNILLQRLQSERLLPVSTLTECVRLIDSGYGDPMLCVCAINPTLQQQQKKQEQQSGGGESGGGSSGGSQPAYAEGEPWNEGLLPEDLLSGMLPRSSGNPVEYLGAAAVSDGRVSGLMAAGQAQLILHAMKECRRQVSVKGDTPQLQLIVEGNGMLSKEGEMLAKAMYALQALDCDALCFGEVAMRAFLTDAEWNAYQFSDKYKTAELYFGKP